MVVQLKGVELHSIKFYGVQLHEGSIKLESSRIRVQLHGVQLHEGSFKQGLRSKKLQLKESSCMEVELYEGSVVRGLSLLRIWLHEGSVGLGFRCTLDQMHEGSVERGLLTRRFSCNPTNVFRLYTENLEDDLKIDIGLMAFEASYRQIHVKLRIAKFKHHEGGLRIVEIFWWEMAQNQLGTTGLGKYDFKEGIYNIK